MPPPEPPSVKLGRMMVGKPTLICDFERLFERFRHFGLRAIQADLDHRAAEQLAILGHADRFARGADQLDVVLFQNSTVGQIQRAIQRGLPAHRRQQRVGAFLGDDASRPCAG